MSELPNREKPWLPWACLCVLIYSLAYVGGWGLGWPTDKTEERWDLNAVARERVAKVAADAEAGNAEAQYQLGVAYALGEGVPQDDAKALHWYDAAAKQNHVMATAMLNMRKSGPSRAQATDSVREAGSSESMALIICQGFVKDRLRSPSTADFPFLDYASAARSDGTYVVRSYVDAQNAFGATVRNHWLCQVRYTGGEDGDPTNWRIIALEIG